MNEEDIAVFCITTKAECRVWAKGELAGVVFELPPNEVQDSEFPLAVPLKQGTVQWCYPSYQQYFPWFQTCGITEKEFLRLTGDKQWHDTLPGQSQL